MDWKVFEEKFPLSYVEIREYIEKFDVKKLNDDDLVCSFLSSKGIPFYGLWVRGLRVYEEKLRNEIDKPKPDKDNQLLMF